MILDELPNGLTDWDVVVEYISEQIFLRPYKIWNYQHMFKEDEDLGTDVRKRLDEKRSKRPKTTHEQLFCPY